MNTTNSAMFGDKNPNPIAPNAVAHEAKLENGPAKRLVEFANKVRAMDELQLAETVSTRLLVTAGKLISSGVAPRVACNAAVVQPITDDQAQLEALQDLANLMF